MDQFLNTYYDGIYFHRVDNRNGLDMFVANIHYLTSNDKKKYVILFVLPQNGCGKDIVRIHEVRWTNLQTRILSDNYTYKGKRIPPQTLKRVKIRDEPLFLTDDNHRTLELTKYISEVCEINDCFEMELLQTKFKSIYQYPTKMPLITALETYACIITRTNNRSSETFEPILQEDDNNMELL